MSAQTGDGDPSEGRSDPAEAGQALAEAGPDLATGDPDVVREIGHDEYDPIGTLVLIGLYFLVLVVLWFFMYFVEFLGNGPTVVDSLATVATIAVGGAR